MNGKLIQCLANGFETAGEKHILWHAENVAPGFYMGYAEITRQNVKIRKTIKMQVSN